MEVRYRCNVVKYDPGDDIKTSVIFILDFEVETELFRRMIINLLQSSLFLPIKSIPIVNQTIGDCSEFYYADIGSRVEIEFINKNNIIFHFLNESITGMIDNEQLEKWGVRRVSELCEGNIRNNVILTNHCYGQIHDEITETYYISKKLICNRGERFC